MHINDVNLRRVRLSESFLSDYKDKEPAWSPMGKFTFNKAYSRRIESLTGEVTKEKFWQTLRRVMEGMMNVQKFHCFKYSIPWDGGHAQHMAQMGFELAWNFKWLPSGRGLWLMGTEFAYKHGSAGLNSCAFVSTAEIRAYPAQPFIWAMEALALGVGVGFDVRGANTIDIKSPRFVQHSSTYVVPDSREGWVESVEVVLNAFFRSEELPSFDYSEIRKKGEPLKSFGGVASGPGPLIKLHEQLVEFMSEKIGQLCDSGLIVDIFTLISQCVVSGNIRRSAMIALGDVQDVQFMGLKAGDNMKLNRSYANNSVMASLGSNYEDIARFNSEKGEPGVIWLDNIRGFGRMVDGSNNADNRVVGVNPCVTGDTLVALADGRKATSFKQLAESGNDVQVYCKDDDGKTVVRMMRRPRVTGKKNVYRVTLDDGSYLDCTSDHRFLMRDGSLKKASDLVALDSLHVTKRWQTTWSEIFGDTQSKKKKPYWMIHDGRKNKFEHTTVAEAFYPDCKEVVHHKDEDVLNNLRANLEPMYSGFTDEDIVSSMDKTIKRTGTRKEAAAILLNHGLCYNHKVVSVEPIGVQLVYNGTVDEFHNYGVVVGQDATITDRPRETMIFTKNCGEQALEKNELCNLIETFPAHHDNYQEFERTLEAAHYYGKTVTLLDTHWSTTNLVMRRNRRLGISQSGIIQSLQKHGHETMRRWCDDGYKSLRTKDAELSRFLRVAESIKLTSVKPSGTVSLLAGATSGIHYPHSEYYIRRQRISNTHQLLERVRDAGYHVEPCVGAEDTTSVIEFPVHESDFDRTKVEVSMWEQLGNAAQWQKYWADNQVSITVTFNKEEAKHLPKALTLFEDQLKCVSLLPLSGGGYVQAPYEEITQEEYNMKVSKLTAIDYNGAVDAPEGEKYCDGDSCSIDTSQGE